MPEGLVQVTEGSGKSLHTFQRVIGANTVEDEVVVQGEPYLADYALNSNGNSVSTATAGSHILQVMAGATLKLRVRRIELYQSTMATAAAMMVVEIRRLTTAGTGGSSFAPAPLDPAEAAAGAVGMTLPTVKGTEGAGLAIWAGAVYMMQTVAASSQLANPILTIDFDRPRMKPLIIGAGLANGFVIKNVSAIAGAAVLQVVYFSEANF